MTHTNLLFQNSASLIESRFSTQESSSEGRDESPTFPNPTQKPKNIRNYLNMHVGRLEKDKLAERAGSTQIKYTKRGNETQVQHIRVELLQSAHLRT